MDARDALGLTWQAEYRRSHIDDLPALRRLRAEAEERYPWLASSLADEIEDIRWRLAVESHRSVIQWREDRYWSDAAWWTIWSGVLALRWSLNARCGPPEGFIASKEVVVRDPGPVMIR